MNRLVQICIAIIGVPFLIVGRSYFFAQQKTLPIEHGPCVFQIIQSSEDKVTTLGVGSYRNNKMLITAYHVVQDCANDCFLKHGISGNISKLFQVQRIGTSDIAIFQANIPNPHCTIPSGGSYVMTFASGLQQMILIHLDGAVSDFAAKYGQSGSPVFESGFLIGVLSRKLQSGSYVEPLP